MQFFSGHEGTCSRREVIQASKFMQHSPHSLYTQDIVFWILVNLEVCCLCIQPVFHMNYTSYFIEKQKPSASTELGGKAKFLSAIDKCIAMNMLLRNFAGQFFWLDRSQPLGIGTTLAHFSTLKKPTSSIDKLNKLVHATGTLQDTLPLAFQKIMNAVKRCMRLYTWSSMHLNIFNWSVLSALVVMSTQSHTSVGTLVFCLGKGFN